MRRSGWSVSVAVIVANLAIVASLRPLAKGQDAKTLYPASLPRPKTATTQSYPVEQIQAGERRFTSQCGFCHGRDAAGGETGPDLTRSTLVAEDNRGDKIAPVIRQGRKEQGMPAFNLSEAELGAIVAFIHDQKTKFEGLTGGRRTVEPADLATGDAEAGLRYFNGAGRCSGCHSAAGDLKGVASRHKGLALLQRMLYPTGRPFPAPAKATLTFPSGETTVAAVAAQDEFTVTVFKTSGEKEVHERSDVKVTIDDPIQAHFTQLGKYTDTDMHNVFAYLDTLK